ncbi:hypothetical protein KSS87_021673 [Heliosperma pusillum]|nr:hypothetical protein KSS87_021673 [Heliosperma pusillum]
METQDHNIPILSGHDVHGGVHVCHKCGWPFPNPHPSSKNRKAHKKVCGTIQNYELDKDAQDKNHLDGYDGEPQSDDTMFKTPSDSGVERTISRRSSSGVGSRSGRSTRSEDEVFTDAVTEFSESPAVVTRMASGGVMQRFYSLQNENEADDAQPTVENSIADADNLCTKNLLKESELQTVQSGEDEKDKVEGGMASQDYISTNPSTVFAACTLEVDNASDRSIIQSSEPSSDVDIVSERGTTKDESKLRTSCSETPEEVAEDISALNGACDEAKGASDVHMASVFADEPVKTSVTEIDGVENKDVRFNVLDTSGRCKVESCNEVDSPGNLYSPVYQGESMNSRTGDISKSELVGECNSKVGANENVCVLAAPDMLPLEQHPATAVEDLDQLRGDNDFSEAPVTTAKNVEYSTEVVTHDVNICSLEDKHEQRQKSVAEQKTFKEADHISPDISFNVDNNTFESELVQDLKGKNPEDEKDSCNEEKKPSTSQGDIFPEGAAMDTGDTTSNADSTRSNIEDDGEYFTVMDKDDKDDSKVSVDGLAVGNSVYMKPTLDEVALQDLEHIHIINSMGKDENIMVKGGIEESSYKETRMEGCLVDNGIDATLKTDNPESTIKVNVDEIPESSCQGSAAVNHCSIEKLSEETSCITENDRVNQQPTTISASDTIVDSGSLADSLDGNWGSVSVISATSDAIPTSETTPLNHPKALEGEKNQSRVPKPVTENQHSQSQLSVKLDVETEQMEHTSEIHSTNEPDRRLKGKEVIDKVDNWDSGKQNTPLKFLLGEATARSRAESPIHNNHSSSSTSNVMPRTNDTFSGMSHPEMETAQEEMGKEWNSPARYPVKIKTEKRQSKSKPYWAQFLCCSSVNAR